MVKEYQFGTSNDKVLLIKDCAQSKAVTLLIRGGSRTICDEAKRCVFDAICVIRNMIKNNNVVCGGGASELACAIRVQEEADKIEGIEQYAVRAFADALEEIPMTLAENSGYSPIEYVQNIKKMQIEENSPYIGVDAAN